MSVLRQKRDRDRGSTAGVPHAPELREVQGDADRGVHRAGESHAAELKVGDWVWRLSDDEAIVHMIEAVHPPQAFYPGYDAEGRCLLSAQEGISWCRHVHANPAALDQAIAALRAAQALT